MKKAVEWTEINPIPWKSMENPKISLKFLHILEEILQKFNSRTRKWRRGSRNIFKNHRRISTESSGIFRNLWKSWPISKYVQVSSIISKESWNNLHRISTESPQNLHRILKQSLLNLHKISTESPQDLHRISTESWNNLYGISTTSPENLHRILG